MINAQLRFLGLFIVLSLFFCNITFAQTPAGPTPISIATTGYSIVKSILGWIHSDNYNAQIAKELKAIEADDQKILTKLDDLSASIDRLQGAVDAETRENRQLWHAWFAGRMNTPIDQFSSELDSYARLGRPTRRQRQEHHQRMKEIYSLFDKRLSEGIGYRNPMAIQLCIAILAEERAGEISDPGPGSRDESMVAHRLQILVNRIQLLSDMADPTQQGSIGNILDTNTALYESLQEDLRFVDNHYVGRDLPYFSEVFHITENRQDQHCEVTVTRRHLAFIAKDDKGYKLTEHIQQDQKHDDACHYYHTGAEHPTGGGHFKQMAHNLGSGPDHLPGVPPDPNASNSQVDWKANVAKYQDGWVKYKEAKALADQLAPVSHALNDTLKSLDSNFESLHNTCKSFKNIDCETGIPKISRDR